MATVPAFARDPQLQRFLVSLEGAFVSHVELGAATSLVDKIFSALRTPTEAPQPDPRRLPVCAHLQNSRRQAAAATSAIADVADSFFAIEPKLHWARRPSSGPFASHNWPEGHANATIVGRGGLEPREDVLIGASLLAPHVRYPDHRHFPEEVYLILSPGRFKNGVSSWVEPGVGGLFHNTPNIEHAMASDEGPLLAIWCLWTAQLKA